MNPGVCPYVLQYEICAMNDQKEQKLEILPLLDNIVIPLNGLLGFPSIISFKYAVNRSTAPPLLQNRC
jgi:hypothetical protein